MVFVDTKDFLGTSLDADGQEYLARLPLINIVWKNGVDVQAHIDWLRALWSSDLVEKP